MFELAKPRIDFVDFVIVDMDVDVVNLVAMLELMDRLARDIPVERRVRRPDGNDLITRNRSVREFAGRRITLQIERRDLELGNIDATRIRNASRTRYGELGDVRLGDS